MMNDQRSKVESSHQWQWGHWDSSFVLPPDWVLNFDFHWIWFWFDRSHRDSSFMLFSLIGSGGATVSGSRGSQGGTAQLGPQPHILARHHQPLARNHHHHHQYNHCLGKTCRAKVAFKWNLPIGVSTPLLKLEFCFPGYSCWKVGFSLFALFVLCLQVQ